MDARVGCTLENKAGSFDVDSLELRPRPVDSHQRRQMNDRVHALKCLSHIGGLDDRSQKVLNACTARRLLIDHPRGVTLKAHDIPAVRERRPHDSVSEQAAPARDQQSTFRSR